MPTAAYGYRLRQHRQLFQLVTATTGYYWLGKVVQCVQYSSLADDMIRVSFLLLLTLAWRTGWQAQQQQQWQLHLGEHQIWLLISI